MKHIGALLLKFFIVTIVLELVLYYTTELTFGDIIIISLAVTLIAYLIGDIVILKNTNNTVATIADIGLSLITILMFNLIYLDATISFFDALLASIFIGIGEWVFHKFVGKIILAEEK